MVPQQNLLATPGRSGFLAEMLFVEIDANPRNNQDGCNGQYGNWHAVVSQQVCKCLQKGHLESYGWCCIERSGLSEFLFSTFGIEPHRTDGMQPSVTESVT